MAEPAGAPVPAELERVAATVAAAVAGLAADGRAGDAGTAIRELLRSATPAAGFSDGNGSSTVPLASLQWVVDPIDGADGPPAAISVAAAIDGDVVAGAVVDAASGECFAAHRGGTATRDGATVAASGCDALADALVAITVPARAAPRGHRTVGDAVAAGVRGVQAAGPPALDLCQVACGRLDGYFERGVDVRGSAAGLLIAEVAGAAVELPCPENDDLVIATAPGVFVALRAAAELPAVGAAP